PNARLPARALWRLPLAGARIVGCRETPLWVPAPLLGGDRDGPRGLASARGPTRGTCRRRPASASAAPTWCRSTVALYPRLLEFQLGGVERRDLARDAASSEDVSVSREVSLGKERRGHLEL